MAKNKNQKQPAKQQSRSAGDAAKGSAEAVSEHASSAPSPMDMARKGRQKKFGHN
ncbi:hypothetical protein AB0B01_19825 [Streptomyces sp. NPDC044571]|uniref:hypothetical protein n=1 Tax=Streptomyces sp. NPDC044571 TaxID=3155371 RepID=UPI003406C269